jgi:hypothetical protein
MALKSESESDISTVVNVKRTPTLSDNWIEPIELDVSDKNTLPIT